MATTYYKRDTNPTNNNWAQANNWSTVASNSSTNTGTYPVAGDTAIFDAGSIQVTVAVAAACAVLNCTNYNNTITMTNNITITGGVTLSSTTVFSGTGTLTLTQNQAITPGGCTSPVAISVGAFTLTLTGGDFYVGALTFTGAATINNDGTSRNLVVNGNISGNYAIAGSAVLYLANTLSWANSNTTGNSMPVVVNASGKTITVSSTVYLRNSAFTVTAGTLSGGTLRFTTSCTITGFGTSSTTAIYLAGTSQTYTLGGAVTTTGAFTSAGTTLVTVATAGYNLSLGAATISVATTMTGSGTVSVTNYGGGATLTMSADWTVSGTLTTANNMVLNGAFNFLVTGSITANFALTGTATLKMTGTGTWTGSAQIAMAMEINTAGTITISGTVYHGTGGFTYTAGTVSGIGNIGFSASENLSFAGSVDCGIFFGGTSQTFTLLTNITTTGKITFSATATAVTVAGGFNLACATLDFNATATYTLTNVNITASGRFTMNTTATMAGNGTIQAASFDTGSLAGTCTISGDWTITGDFANTNAPGFSLNGVGKKIYVGGNLTLTSYKVQGSALMIANGTGNWDAPVAAPLQMPLQINTAGTITFVSNFRFAGSDFTYTAGTIAGGPLIFYINGTCNLDTNTGGTIPITVKVMEWGGGADFTLLSNFACTTMTIIPASSNVTFAGDFDMTFANLNIYTDMSVGRSVTFRRSRTVTVTTSLTMESTKSAGGLLTVSSDLASTSFNLAYQGTSANMNVYGITFTDVNASTSAVPIEDWMAGTLTRTVNIYSRTTADLKKEGVWGATAVAKEIGALARGGSGTAVKLTPSSLTDAGIWAFLVPVNSASAFTLAFYHRITAGFNGSMTVTVYDTDDSTKLLDASAITFINDAAYHQFSSGALTPTATGFCRVVCRILKGAVAGSVYVDDLTVS